MIKVRVICAGMHRSGSTWVYNVIRHIYLEHGHRIYSAFANNEYDPENKASVHIVKTHAFKMSILPAKYIITTCRDLRDIAASAFRRDLVKASSESIIKYIDNVVLREYEPWEPYSHYEVKYEEMHKDKLRVISKIADTLYMPLLERSKVMDAVESLSPPSEPGGFDQKTQLHYNHITNGTPRSYRTTLSQGIIAAIESKYGKWLEEKGYKIEQQ